MVIEAVTSRGPDRWADVQPPPNVTIEFHKLEPDDYPFTAELFNGDSGEVLWRTEVTGPCLLRLPSLGGQGFPVRARILFSDGQTIEETVP